MNKPKGLVDSYGRECAQCGTYKSWENYCKGSAAKGRTSQCLECRNTRQRERRKKEYSTKYEKTKKGFLVRLYRNMQSRVTGVQKAKHHLYAGVKLLPRAEFYKWSENNTIFHDLFNVWEAGGYDQKLTPSVDRLDPFYGYELWNMEWVTHSENSRRGSLGRWGTASDD